MLWFASGQAIDNIDDFLRGSFEVVSGYSESLQLDGEHFAADVPLAILISLATLAFAVWATRAAPRARRIGIGAIVVVLVYTLAKQGIRPPRLRPRRPLHRRDRGAVARAAGPRAAARWPRPSARS